MTEYAYQKRWHHDRQQGIFRTTDAGPARERVEQLIAAGWSQRGISEASGIGATTVTQIRRRQVARIKHATARALLAVTEDAILNRPNGNGFVRRVGAQRRVRALLAAGHRHADITSAMRAARPDVNTMSNMILSQSGTWITKGTHDAVCAAYDALSMRAGTSVRTRLRALAAGYPPPLAWDDEQIDDPAAMPYVGEDINPARDISVSRIPGDIDEIAVERAMRGERVPLSKAERSEVFTRLNGMGLSASQIGELLGVTGRTIVRKRSAAA